MPYRDKEKTKQAQKNYYLRNKEKIKARTYQIRKELREWFVEYKSTLKCERCPESHISTLDFHHKDKDKKIDLVGRMVHNGYKKEAIIKEIEKCDVLCANCHRKLHYINN